MPCRTLLPRALPLSVHSSPPPPSLQLETEAMVYYKVVVGRGTVFLLQGRTDDAIAEFSKASRPAGTHDQLEMSRARGSWHRFSSVNK